jgi:hypothetical protein
MLDKSGRGNHATQTTSTSRPVLKQDAGGQYYLKFDGVDDFMQNTAFALPLIERMTAIGFAEDVAVANQGCVSVYPAAGSDWTSGSGYVFSPSNRTTSRFSSVARSGNYQNDWLTSPASVIGKSVITENKKAGQSYMRVNAVQVGSDLAFTEFSAVSDGGLLLGARWAAGAVQGAGKLNGRIYGLIIRGAATTDTRIAQTERWVNKKTGAY